MLAFNILNHKGRIEVPLENLHTYIKEKGMFVSPRGSATYECLNFTADIVDTTHPYRPNVNTMLQYVEGLNLVAGYTNIEALHTVAPKTTKRFYSTNAMSWYAEPLAGQLPQIIRTLQQDSASRKAIAYLGHNRWCPEDMTCVTSVQFLIRNYTLYTIVNMRSLDLYLGFPYDIPMFELLAQAIKSILGIHLGHLHLQAASAHIYAHSYKEHTWSWQASPRWSPLKVANWTAAQDYAETTLQQIISREVTKCPT